MSDTEDDPLIGTLVGDRYRVGRKLGQGGMGLVYLAVHEALHKQVALKVLSSTGRIERETIARFEREAIAAANLKHPNIAEATDFGQLPGGGLYLVMEYVEGTTLRRLVAEHGKIAPERALAILQQVASALATAHARDVVHRDLKPDNVIVTSVPGQGGSGSIDVVKVIDFGIAKLRSATFGGGGTALTREGMVFGTPEYMSPEQVMGQVVDARADQYALGVLAFELLTGKPPYKADDVAQLMMMHVGAPVPSTREQTPGLPPALDVVTTRMLAKLPDERFDSVMEAMQALATALLAPSVAPAIGAAVLGLPEPRAATVKLTPEPSRAVAHETATLPSPGNEVVRADVARRSRIVALAAGVATLLLGVLVVALFARSCSEPTSAAIGNVPAAENAPDAAAAMEKPPGAEKAPAAEKALPRAGATATSAVPVAVPATSAAPVAVPATTAAPVAPTKTQGKGKGKSKKDR